MFSLIWFNFFSLHHTPTLTYSLPRCVDLLNRNHAHLTDACPSQVFTHGHQKDQFLCRVLSAHVRCRLSSSRIENCTACMKLPRTCLVLCLACRENRSVLPIAHPLPLKCFPPRPIYFSWFWTNPKKYIVRVCCYSVDEVLSRGAIHTTGCGGGG